ncbi:MAG: hypothetical protein RL186_639 [Pseudomonadota bacterium]
MLRAPNSLQNMGKRPQGSECGLTRVKDRRVALIPAVKRGRGQLLVIVPLTQKPDVIVMGLSNRVKARAARSAALTRLLNPASCSVVQVVCRGLSSTAKPPRSGAKQWHPLQHRADIQQSMQHFGIGTAVTKVRPKPLLLASVRPMLVGFSIAVNPSLEPYKRPQFRINNPQGARSGL